MMGNLTPDQIEEVLRSEVIGRIACVADGWPYIVPITYVYDGGEFVFSHSAEGRKIEAMRQNPQVCFEVEQIKSIASWRTVIARGRFEPLARDAEERAMDLLGGNSRGSLPERHRPTAEKMSIAARGSFVRSSSRSGSSSERAALSSPEVGPVRMPAPSLSLDVPQGAEALAEIAFDLRSGWSHGADRIWERIAPDLWRSSGNPWLVMQTASRDRLRDLWHAPEFRALVERVRGDRAAELKRRRGFWRNTANRDSIPWPSSALNSRSPRPCLSTRADWAMSRGITSRPRAISACR